MARRGFAVVPRFLTREDVCGFCPDSWVLLRADGTRGPLGNEELPKIVQHCIYTAWWGTALSLAFGKLR